MTQCLADVRSIGEKAVPLDCLFAAGIASSEAKCETQPSAAALFGAARRVDQNERLDGFARGVIESNVGAHRMADQNGWPPVPAPIARKSALVAVQVVEKRFQVVVEGANYKFIRSFGVAMAAKVECDHVEAVGKRGRDVSPPVAVRASAVQEDELRVCGVSPLQGMKGRPGIADSNSSGSQLHSRTSLVARRVLVDQSGVGLVERPPKSTGRAALVALLCLPASTRALCSSRVACRRECTPKKRSLWDPGGFAAWRRRTDTAVDT